MSAVVRDHCLGTHAWASGPKIQHEAGTDPGHAVHSVEPPDIYAARRGNVGTQFYKVPSGALVCVSTKIEAPFGSGVS